MGLDTVERSMRIDYIIHALIAAKEHSYRLEKQSVLENRVTSEPVIGRILVDFVIYKLIT